MIGVLAIVEDAVNRHVCWRTAAGRAVVQIQLEHFARFEQPLACGLIVAQDIHAAVVGLHPKRPVVARVLPSRREAIQPYESRCEGSTCQI